MNGDQRPARTQRLFASMGALCAAALCFSLAFPAFNQRAAAPSGAQVAVQAAPGAAQAAREEDALGVFVRERESVRALEMEQLRSIAADEQLDAALRAQAGSMLTSLIGFMEQEVTLEGVLRARGFEQVVCTVHQDSVNVLVKAQSVTQAQSAQILELAVRETGQSGGNVKIIPVT